MHVHMHMHMPCTPLWLICAAPARLLHKKAENLLESAAKKGGCLGLLTKLLELGQGGNLQPTGSAGNSKRLRVRVRWLGDRVCKLRVTKLLAYQPTILLAYSHANRLSYY